MNVLILGVCGFIGTYLRKALQIEHNIIGYDIVKPDNTDTENYKYINGDFTKDSFDRILADNDIDIIYHFISSTVPTFDTSIIADEIIQNVIPTVNLLDSMVNANVKRLIFASSAGTVYGELIDKPHKVTDRLNPICSYGISKVTIENYLMLYNKYHNLSCISARMTNPYGLWVEQNRAQGIIPLFINSLLNNQPITLYGNTLRDYIHINDITNALARLISYTGNKSVFNIGSGKSHQLSEIVNIIEKVCGRKFFNVVHNEIRMCDVNSNAININETKYELSWMPEYTVYDGINGVYQQYLLSKNNNF